MSYYSEVAICFPLEVGNEFITSINNLPDGNEESLKTCLLDLMKIADTYENDISVLYVWSSVKWYPEWDTIKFIDEFLKDHSYYSIIIGENYDDVKTEGDYLENGFGLAVERMIVYDAGIQKL